MSKRRPISDRQLPSDSDDRARPRVKQKNHGFYLNAEAANINSFEEMNRKKRKSMGLKDPPPDDSENPPAVGKTIVASSKSSLFDWRPADYVSCLDGGSDGQSSEEEMLSMPQIHT